MEKKIAMQNWIFQLNNGPMRININDQIERTAYVFYSHLVLPNFFDWFYYQIWKKIVICWFMGMEVDNKINDIPSASHIFTVVLVLMPHSNTLICQLVSSSEASCIYVACLVYAWLWCGIHTIFSLVLSLSPLLNPLHCYWSIKWLPQCANSWLGRFFDSK